MAKNIFTRPAARNFFIAIGIALALTASIIVIKDEINYLFFYNGPANQLTAGSCYPEDNVALIKIHGAIVTYTTASVPVEDGADPAALDPYASQDLVSAEDVNQKLDEIEADDRIRGILVEIVSPGGCPAASEEIMKRLLSSTKPVAAYIREYGYSGGYLIATGADRIFASPMSDVGSIGITMSYTDKSKKNKIEGITFNQISTGKFKDMGDPEKELTAEEKAVFLADLQKSHEIFVDYVAQNRTLDRAKVAQLADGSSMIAGDAVNAGLIDAIGGFDEAALYLEKAIGEPASVCRWN